MIREAHRCLNAVSRIFNGAEGAVPFQDHLYQIEAKAASSGLSASGNFFPVKGLEEVFKGLGPYVDTGVFNGKTGDALLCASPYADFGAVRRVEGCVGKQVSCRFAEQAGVSGYNGIWCQTEYQPLPALLWKLPVQLNLLPE